MKKPCAALTWIWIVYQNPTSLQLSLCLPIETLNNLDTRASSCMLARLWVSSVPRLCHIFSWSLFLRTLQYTVCFTGSLCLSHTRCTMTTHLQHTWNIQFSLLKVSCLLLAISDTYLLIMWSVDLIKLLFFFGVQKCPIFFNFVGKKCIWFIGCFQIRA